MATPTLRDAFRTMQRGIGYDEGWIATNASAADDTPWVEIKATPGSGKRLCITSITITNTGSGTGIAQITETGLSGAVVWRGVLQAGNTNATQFTVQFEKPLICTENVPIGIFGVANHALLATVAGFTASSDDIK